MKKAKLHIVCLIVFLTVTIVHAQNEFITTWQTVSDNETITIPTFSGETYNYDIDWNNDGIFDDIGVTGNATHSYSSMGIHTIVIRGNFPRIYVNFSADREKLLTVEQWGNQVWSSMEDAFTGCSNLVVNATDAPVLTNVTSIARMFFLCTNINQSFDHWDVSTITNMSSAFSNTSFNQSLASWTVNNLRDASSLFSGTPFNQDLSSWNVSDVEEFGGMFQNATAFNQDISGWNVASATEMQSMFNGATAFNQDITNWDVSGVEFMQFMFANTTNFNQDISNWDVSNVSLMNNMFSNATSFDKNIGNWDISNVINVTDMFANTNLSVVNYDALLTGWSNLETGETQIPLNLNFTAGTNNYCNATTERDNLINTYGWTISDGGIGCLTPETHVDFTAGVLSITDTGVQDDFVYTLTSNNDILIFHSLIPGISVNGTGITNIDDNTLEIPLALITNGLIIDGVNEEEGSVNLNINYNFTTADVMVNNAVYINQSGDLQTTTGDITFLAKGGTTVDGNVETTTGQITMHGFSEGIDIIATADFTDPWGFMLLNATYGTHGVHVTTNASIHTVNGGIELYGTATRGSAITVRHGVYIQGTITATGTGSVGVVDIKGRGQLSGFSSTGVNIDNATISTVDTPLNFWGLGAINGRIGPVLSPFPLRRFSEGVFILESNISSTGVGNMNFYGKSGENITELLTSPDYDLATPQSSDGVEIIESNLSSTDGNITIEGVLNEINVDPSNRYGGDAVRVYRGSIMASGDGNITLTGEGHQTDFPPNYDPSIVPSSDGVNIGSPLNGTFPFYEQGTFQSHDGNITINTKRGKFGSWLNTVFGDLRASISTTGIGNININAYASVYTGTAYSRYTLAIGSQTQAPVSTVNGNININAFAEDGSLGSIRFATARTFTINGTGNLNIFADEVVDLGRTTTRLFGGGSINVTADIYTVDNCSTIVLENFNITPKTIGNNIGIGDNATGDLNLLNSAFCPTASAVTTTIGDVTSGNVDLNTFSLGLPMKITGKNFTINDFSTGNSPLQLVSTPGSHIQESNPTNTAISTAELIIDGTLSPGDINNQGVFTVIGNVTLSDNDTYIVDLVNTSNPLDQLKLQGAAPILTLNDANLVVTTSLYTPVVNEEIIIIDIEGTNTAIGTFNGLAEGDTLLVDGEMFVISYLGGDGNDVSLTNQNTLGILDTESSSSISIFPNPTRTKFTLKNNRFITLQRLDIYEITGRLVKTFAINDTQELRVIDVSDLSNGTYFINISSEHSRIIKKLIIE